MTLSVQVTIPKLTWAPDVRALRAAVIRGAAAIAKDVRARIADGQQYGGAAIPLTRGDKDGRPLHETGQTVGSIAAKGGRRERFAATVAPRGYHGGAGRAKALGTGKVRFVGGTTRALGGVNRSARIKALRKHGLVPTSLILAVQARRRKLSLLKPGPEMLDHARESINRALLQQQRRMIKQAGTIRIR